MQYWWTEEFGPEGLGVYAGKSYWLATYNWENQNYPVDRNVYSRVGGFANGYVPLFIVIGYKNKVYWNSNSNNFRDALRLAIDEIVAEGVWVDNPITDKVLLFGESQNIDISTVFADIDNEPITVTLESNDNPDILLANLNGDILTIIASESFSGTATISLKGATRDFDEVDQFKINVFDPDLYIIEDYETGDFTLFPWTFGGSANWTIEPSDPYEGLYCTRSEDISDNQTTDMIVNVDYVIAGNVSFQHKTSCESNYDYLKFYIDGIEKGKWSSVTSWVEASFPAEAGSHTFKWTYQKDGSMSSGSDCAWVDRIVFEGGIATSIEDSELRIQNLELYQNYPNPFNPITDILFSLDKQSQVKISVYNYSGQLVKTLIDRSLNSGTHNVKFDASNLNSGTYYYKLETPESKITKKMILIK